MRGLKKWLVGICIICMSTAIWGAQVETELVTGMDGKTVEERTQAGRSEGLQQIKSYEQLIDLLNKHGHLYEKGRKEYEDINYGLTTAEQDGGIERAPENTAGETGIYSETNTQVAGVDEADQVKVDDRYIYSCVDSKSIAIVDTKDSMKQVASISYRDPQLAYNYTVNKMFVDDKYLTVILNYSVDGQKYYS